EITFSKPVNPGTVVANGVHLLDTNGAPVTVSVSLDLRNTTLRLLPTTQLAPNTKFTISLAGTVADPQGHALEGTKTFAFTTAGDALDRRTSAQLIIFEPGATNIPPAVLANIPAFKPGEDKSSVVVQGTAGAADPEQPVVLVNDSSGETSTTLSKA